MRIPGRQISITDADASVSTTSFRTNTTIKMEPSWSNARVRGAVVAAPRPWSNAAVNGTVTSNGQIPGRSFAERIEPRRRRELEWPPTRSLYQPPPQSSAPAAVAAAVTGGGYIDASEPGNQHDRYRPLPPFRIPASGAVPPGVKRVTWPPPPSSPPLQPHPSTLPGYEPATVISLRVSPPVSQAPSPVVISQPVAAKMQGGVHARGDSKWPPQQYKTQADEENAARIALAKGPACRPRKVNRDYSGFFAQHALNDTYPGYRAPPGTQHYLDESGTSDL